MDEEPFLTRRALLGGSVLLLGAAAFPAWAESPFSSRRIIVTNQGTGPDVLLIAGLASGPGVWTNMVKAVPGYRYHLVQVRGFAGTAPDLNRSGPLLTPLVAEIARYVEVMGLRRPAIIGHSMGGTLAMLLGLRPSPRIGRLMIVDMLPEGAGMVGGTASGMGYLADQLGQYFTATKAGRKMFADMLARTPGGRDSDPDVVANALKELAHIDLRPRLGNIGPPMRVVHAVPADAQQRRLLIDQYRTAYAAAKSVRLTPVGPSGHVIMADQPTRFAAEMRAFLTEGG